MPGHRLRAPGRQGIDMGDLVTGMDAAKRSANQERRHQPSPHDGLDPVRAPPQGVAAESDQARRLADSPLTRPILPHLLRPAS